MGAVDDDIESAFVKVDLHGLFANEANEIIQEYILPVLHVLKKMVIITGRGAHNKSRKAVLKQEVKLFLTSRQIKFEDVLGNDGAIYVFY